MRVPSLAVSLLVAALLPGSASAQQERVVLTGTILSRTQVAVPGALITIPALRLSAVTNDAGNYRLVIPNAPADRRVAVVVTSIGYSSAENTVSLTGQSTRYDVRLDEQAIALDRVVVTGTAGRQERRAQSATISTIDAQKVSQV